MNSKLIQSPICPDAEAKFLYSIKKSDLLKAYKKFGIDITYLLKDYSEISIYECSKTGYKFYFPLDVAGDSKFYEFFQKFDWYYMPWKWEHEITKDFIENGQSVLEIGCAHGAFLKKINEMYQLKESVGLELNETASVEMPTWKILNESIQVHQKTKNDSYDLVCAFQVLEHIADVYSFIQASINCLKKGGKLILSVPNNESFVKNLKVGLNMPPHHMGLWDTKSLESLAKIFPLKKVKIFYEQLQNYHIDSYIDSFYYNKYPFIIPKLLRKFDKLTGKYQKIKNEIERDMHSKIGHTVLAVFEKI